MTCGTVNGCNVSTMLRDTGCSNVIVSDKVLPDVDTSKCKFVTVSDYLGTENSFPLVRCYINCVYYRGWVDAIRAPIKFCAVLIGNVPGVEELEPQIRTTEYDAERTSANPEVLDHVNAVTRASKERVIHPLVLPKLDCIKMSPKEFKRAQQICPTLSDIRAKAKANEIASFRDGSEYSYVNENDILYRKCVKSPIPSNVGKAALIVPAECRSTVLQVAHESPLAGHFSHRKTETKLKSEFFWPGMSMDIRNFCRSCDKCQRMSAKGRVSKVPLMSMPIITEPFSRVAIDLVGPLSPPSEDKHR